MASHILQIQEDIKARKVSIVQRVQEYIDAIEQHAHLNAFIEVYVEEALQRAKDLEKKMEEGKPLGKLFGIVVGVKDNICYKDHRVTACSEMLRNYVSPFSATVVDRCVQEDAIIIGSLNCDEFAVGNANRNSIYGPVLNPIDNTRVAGGSSGGSACAVSAKLCDISLGSDTGGSVRQPASFCGIYGFKPSYGLFSRYGLIAFSSSFDTVGIFANSVEDMAIVTQSVGGKDGQDYSMKQSEVPTYAIQQEVSLSGKKIAVIRQTVEYDMMTEDIKLAMTDIQAKLEKQGAIVECIDFPYFDHLLEIYSILTNSELSSNMARYTGILYGNRTQDTHLEDMYRNTRTQYLGKEVKKRIIIGNFILSSNNYEKYYVHTLKVRNLIKKQTEKLFETFDAILTPTCPNVAFTLDKVFDSSIEDYMQDAFVLLANIVGAPAITIPYIETKEKLPIGVQVMTNAFEEQTLFDISRSIARLK